MLEVANFLDEVYKRYSLVKNTPYYNICRSYADKSAAIVKWGIISSFFVLFIYSMYPFVYYIIFGEIFPPLRIYAPGIDENTTSGFIFLTLFNVSILICTVYVIYPVDILTINIFTNIPMVSTIFIERMKDFQGGLQRKALTPIDIKRELLTIIVMHHQYDG